MGIVIYHETIVTPTDSYSLADPGTPDQSTFQASAGTLARFAVEADISTPSVQEDPDSLNAEYQARFQFPISYTITDGTGSILADESEVLAWKDGASISKSNEEVTSTGGTLRATSNFDKFTVPADGIVNITIELSPDVVYEASIISPTLHFYEDLIGNTGYIIGGATMLLAGFILSIVGFIFAVTNAS